MYYSEDILCYNPFMKVKGFKDTINWYDENAEYYANATADLPPIDIINRFINLLPNNSKVLDVGCGAGRDTALFNEKGIDAVGLDISKGLLREAKRRSPKCIFIEGSFLELPFDREIFNGIWAHAALVHLETIVDVKKSLQEFYRVLKNEGILHLHVKKQIGSEKVKVVKDTLSNHERFFRYYTEEEVRTYLREVNFKITDFNVLDDPHGRKEVKWISIFAKK